jgi:predicted Zn-dependent protease
MRKFAPITSLALFAALLCGTPAFAKRPAPRRNSRADDHPLTIPAGDNDQTLRAMRDEMERSRTRLVLPGVDKPFYIEYRLIDVDFRTITASFGSLLASSTSRSRQMIVDVRVGNYHLDSSNFLSEDGFQGFLGRTGQVGIDRDYNSLRQDLWLATDQAYKEAVTQMSLKEAFLRSLTKPPEIDDFAQAQPIVKVSPRVEPDWTSRKWEDEAREASAALKNFQQLYGTRVTYSLVYTTIYRMNSEGTIIRESRHLAGIEAGMDTEAEDGMPLSNFYAYYTADPSGLPDAATVAKSLTRAATDLTAERDAALVPDYTGPVLFDAPAAAQMLAQVLEPSLSGARAPLATSNALDEFLDRYGGRNEWTGRVNTRVLPTGVSLIDDPTAKDFGGMPLLGSYDLDAEGVPGQRVTIVDNGLLKNLLMSRRPGPDFYASNGHARSAMLSEPAALSSNLFFQSSSALGSTDIRKKFLDACKDDGHEWCLEVKRMANPALSALQTDDFSEFVGEMGGGFGSGMRMPLLVYRVYVADGREEPVRGGILDGLTLRSLRNMLAIGSDSTVYTYMQNAAGGLASTALGSFGSIQDGIPSTIIAPSLLLDDVEVRGFHGEPRRLPPVPPPPLQ